MDPFLDWVRTNWGETGLLGTWAGILARLLWKNARAWCSEARRWYRSRGSTKTLGLIKHRDEDDDVVMIWEVMGIRFNFHSTGKQAAVTPRPPSHAQLALNIELHYSHRRCCASIHARGGFA